MKHLTTLFAILLLSGCSAIPRLEVKETHTVKAGTHTNVLQNHLTWNDWTNIFYQCDWNKLGGGYVDLLNTAWRLARCVSINQQGQIGLP